MKRRRAGRSLIIVFISLFAGCVSVQEHREDVPRAAHNIKIPPMNAVAAEDQKLWEGEINGRSVVHYRREKAMGIDDVIVSTQDDLPEYFKRIEYLDTGGDGNLDLMRMEVYEKAKGWRHIGITKDNEYGLGYADSEYKKLREEIQATGEANKD